MLSWRRYPGRFVLIVLLAAALFLVLEAVNGRLWLNDFRVYYEASAALLRGDRAYGVAHGLSSGYFKYAPVMAGLYAPMAALPYPIAAGLQFVLIVLAFLGAMLTADRIIRTAILPDKPGAYVPLFLATLIAGTHLHRELHLGNINALLLCLLMGGLSAQLDGRSRLAGLLWGLALLAKPHFAVLLPWLVVRGERRTLLWMVASVAIGLLAPLPFLGMARWQELHEAWLKAMASHNAALVYTGGDAYQMVDTAYSFAHRALLGRQLHWPVEATVAAVLGLCAAVGLALVLRSKRKEHEAPSLQRAHIAQEAFLLIAAVPSLTVTDTNHFLFALPLVLLLIHRLWPCPQPRWLPYAAVPVLLAHGGNWSDALGGLSERMVHYGLLGIANLLLVALSAVLLLQQLNARPMTDSKP